MRFRKWGKIDYSYQSLLMEYQDKVSHSKHIVTFKNKPELNWSWVQADTVRLQIQVRWTLEWNLVFLICFQDKCSLDKYYCDIWLLLKRATGTYILNLVKIGPITAVIWPHFWWSIFWDLHDNKNFCKTSIDFSASSQIWG